MSKLWKSIGALGAVFALAMAFWESPTKAQTFDLDTGAAPYQVVIPTAVPPLFTSVSAAANDATLVLRLTTMVTNAWFDAVAPYHPTAVGVYSRLGRRPPSERATNRNMNIATLYASYRVLLSLLPAYESTWREMLSSLDLDPDDDSEDLTTPVGIGNRAGRIVAAVRERDGMNQLGDEGGCRYNCQPYADYTGYQPINTAHFLKYPSRWQPNIVTMGNGLFQVQQFVTPQVRLTRPYSFDHPGIFMTPPPENSVPRGSAGRAAYKQQADEVLETSAALTDYQKMASEFFDNKILSIGLSAVFIAQSRNLTVDEFVHYDFTVNAAAFDGAITTWNEKFRHDAVRPFSAIRYLYGDDPVTAWGGPGRGTVNDLPASQWRSYLSTADHPEYPSASACFCAAHAQASRRFLGSDQFGWSVPAPAGSSRIEPGVTPANDITLGPWETWTDFEQECGMSRHWGGVHFLASIPVGQDLCRPVGDMVYEFVQSHIDGTAPAPRFVPQ